jgi:hypothetical protein
MRARISAVLFYPSVLFFAVSVVVFVTMVALTADPSSGKVTCEPEEVDPTTEFSQTCTGGAGTGSGGQGGRIVTEQDDDGATFTFSGGEGEGTNEVTEPHNFGGHASFTFDSEGDVVTGTYSGAAPNRGTKGGGRCTFEGLTQECVGSEGFAPELF